MSQDQWMDTSFKYQQKKEKLPTQQKPQRGRRGEDLKPSSKKEQKEEEKQIAENQRSSLDQSNWLQSNQVEDPQQKEIKATRGAECSNDITIICRQLQPDEPLNSSWQVQSQKNKSNQRGSRQNFIQQDKSQQKPKRGNRETFNFTKKESYFAQQNDQGSKGGYNGYNSNYRNKDDGNRGRGRGRGRGGYRGNYQGRQGQEDRDYRSDGRAQNNFYKKRDNQQSTNEKGRTQEQQQGPKRGNRGNRDYNQNQGYRPNNSDFNNDRDRNYNNNNRNNNNRNYNNRGQNNNNYRGDYNNRGQFNNSRGEYNNNRGEYSNNRGEYNNNRGNGYNGYNNREDNGYNGRQNSSYSYQQKKQAQQPSTSKVQSKMNSSINSTNSIEKSREEFIPKGRRCWPESSIYILGCKFCITYRPISEFKCKLLVIPYATLKMEYYPGNIINSSQVDYKARILAKGELVSSPGSVYLQKAISVGTFIGLAFLKIQEKRISDSLKVGIKKLLTQLQTVEGPALDSLIFPICKQLSNTQTIIESVLQNLQNCKKIKEVYVTTNQSQCFMEAMNLFTEKVQQMLNDNQILIN